MIINKLRVLLRRLDININWDLKIFPEHQWLAKRHHENLTNSELAFISLVNEKLKKNKSIKTVLDCGSGGSPILLEIVKSHSNIKFISIDSAKSAQTIFKKTYIKQTNIIFIKSNIISYLENINKLDFEGYLIITSGLLLYFEPNKLIKFLKLINLDKNQIIAYEPCNYSLINSIKISNNYYSQIDNNQYSYHHNYKSYFNYIGIPVSVIDHNDGFSTIST